jgi:hypothetical protein
MKALKTIFAAIIFSMIVVFASCEKEPIYCYECLTTYNNEIVSKITTCGMTDSEIGDFQAGIEAQASACLHAIVETECKRK